MLFSSIRKRTTFLIALLSLSCIGTTYSQVRFNDLSIKKDYNYSGTELAFYHNDSDKRVARAHYSVENYKDYAYLHLLLVEQGYRSAGLGSQVFKSVMRDIAETIKTQRPGITKVRWWACPFDPPAGVRRSDMQNRLYDFYRRQGAKVDRNGHAELDLVEKGYL